MGDVVKAVVVIVVPPTLTGRGAPAAMADVAPFFRTVTRRVVRMSPAWAVIDATPERPATTVMLCGEAPVTTEATFGSLDE